METEFRFLVTLTILAASTSGQSPGPFATTTPQLLDLVGLVRTFDAYGDQTDVFYGDGYTIITCTAAGNCTNATTFDMLLDGNVVESKPCERRIAPTNFTVQVARVRFKLAHENMQFGQYACQYGGKTVPVIRVRTKLCKYDSQFCRDDACKREGFCVIDDGAKFMAKPHATNTCGFIPKGVDNCPKFELFITQLCPIAMTRCESMQDTNFAYKNGHVLYVGLPNGTLPPCQSDSEHVFYKGRKYFYEEPIHAEPNASVRVVCPPNSLGHNQLITCTVKDLNGTVFNQTVMNCDENSATLSFSMGGNPDPTKINLEGPYPYKIVCELKNASGSETSVQLANTYIVTDASIQIDPTLDSNGKPQSLRCHLPTLPEPDFGFSANFSWTKPGNTTPIQTGETYNVQPTDTGVIVCNVTVQYVNCVPQRRFNSSSSAPFSLDSTTTAQSTLNTVALDNTTMASENTTSAENATLPENTTLAFENTTLTAENTTLASENTTLIADNTTLENITLASENVTLPGNETIPDATPPSNETASQTWLRGYEIIHDKFHTRVSLYYGDGHRVIVCEVDSCNRTGDIELLIDGNVSDAKICQEDTTFDEDQIYGAGFDLSNTTVYLDTIIQCRYFDQIANVTTAKAALCTECTHTSVSCDSDKFCVMTYDANAERLNVDVCGIIPPGDEYCSPYLDDIVCPAGTENLCKAIQQGQYDKAFMFGRNNTCPPDPVQYIVNGNPVLLDDFVLYENKETNISINCPPKSHFHNHTLRFALAQLTGIDWLPAQQCDGDTKVHLENVAQDSVPSVYRLLCTILEGPMQRRRLSGTLSMYLVSLDGNLTILSHDNETTGGPPNTTDLLVTLECQISGKRFEQLVADGFSMTYKWTDSNNVTLGHDPKLNIGTEGGVYKCEVELEYKVCAPYRRFNRTLYTYFNASDIRPTVLPQNRSLTIDQAIFDRFGDPVDVYYADGTTAITCTVPECNDTNEVILRQGGNIIGQKPCNGTGAVFRMDNTDLKLGIPYECAYGMETAQLPALQARFCRQSSAECQDPTTCPSGPFCMVTHDSAAKTDQAQKCSFIPSSQNSCPGEASNYSKALFCPTKHSSLCESMKSDAFSKAFSKQWIHDGDCSNDSEMVVYKTQPRYYHEMFQIDMNDTEINIKCPQSSFLKNIACSVKRGVDDFAQSETEQHCDEATKYHIVISHGAGIYKLQCVITGPQLRVELANYLVITEITTFHFNHSINDSVICEPEYSEPIFIVNTWWTKENDSTKLGTDAVLPLSDLVPDGYYECHVSVEYRSCAPYQVFKSESKAFYQHISSDNMTIDENATGVTPTVANATAVTNASVANATVLTGYERIFDRFGDPVDLPYANGWREVVCEVECDPSDTSVILVYNGTGQSDSEEEESCSVISVHDGANISGAVFRLDKYPDLATPEKFVEFTCHYKNMVAKVEIFKSRFCPDTGPACLSVTGCANDKFCVMSQQPANSDGKIESCAAFPKATDTCLSLSESGQKSLYCPVGTSSLCEALQKDQLANAKVQYRNQSACGSDYDRLSYNGTDRYHLETFVYIPNVTDITVSCPPASPAHNGIMRCSFKTEQGQFIIAAENISCAGAHLIQMEDKIIQQGPTILKFECSIHSNSDHVVARLINYVVLLVPYDLRIWKISEVELRELKKRNPSLVNYAFALQCGFKNPLPANFYAAYQWLKNDSKTGETVVFWEEPVVPYHEENEHESFKCLVTIAYKTCSPHQEFRHKAFAEVNVSAPASEPAFNVTPPSTKTSTSTTTTEETTTEAVTTAASTAVTNISVSTESSSQAQNTTTTSSTRNETGTYPLTITSSSTTSGTSSTSSSIPGTGTSSSSTPEHTKDTRQTAQTQEPTGSASATKGITKAESTPSNVTESTSPSTTSGAQKNIFLISNMRLTFTLIVVALLCEVSEPIVIL